MSWKRPSAYVLLCAFVIVGSFAYRGDLAVGETAKVRRHREPVVVKLQSQPSRPSAATAELHGSVFDALGFLVVGAEVAVAGLPAVRTDADGRFRLSLPAGSAAELTVTAAGQRPLRTTVAGIGQEPLVLSLQPAAPWDPALPAPQPPVPATLFGEGRVRDANDRPVAQAVVTVAETGATARTDETGHYRIPLPLGAVTLVASQPTATDGPGLAARAEVPRAGRDKGMLPLPDLIAAAAGAIRGTLRDPRGQPIAGVPVWLRGEGLSRILESGQGGVFRFAGLLPGRYSIEAMAFRGTLGATRCIDLDEPVVDCELQMQAVGKRRVQVVREDGTAVAAAFVASTQAGMRRQLVQTDASGFAELQAPEALENLEPPFEYEVRAEIDHRALPVVGFDGDHARLIVASP